MDSIVALVNELATRDQPMLTWYGANQERVDLTGRTAANWITKAANLLVLDTDCHVGTRVWLDLPWHWRAVVWATAALSTGAELVVPGELVQPSESGSLRGSLQEALPGSSHDPSSTGPADSLAQADSADIAITASPRPAHEPLETIVIALPALAREVDDLPSWAIDGAADLMSQADAWAFAPTPAPTAATGLGVSQTQLLASPEPLANSQPTSHRGAPRYLLLGNNLAAGLAATFSAWGQGASIVIADDAATASLEGATHMLSLPDAVN